MVQMDILNSHNCCHQNNENIWKMCLWPISAGGAYSALPNPLAGFRESLRGRGGREGKGRRVEREGNRKEEKGRGQKGRKGKELSYTYGLACHRHVPLQSNVVISHTDKFYRM